MLSERQFEGRSQMNAMLESEWSENAPGDFLLERGRVWWVKLDSQTHGEGRLSWGNNTQALTKGTDRYYHTVRAI